MQQPIRTIYKVFSKMEKPTQIIIAIGIALAIVINSIIVTWGIYRRPADEVIKIKTVEFEQKLQCKDNGGKWSAGVCYFD